MVSPAEEAPMVQRPTINVERDVLQVVFIALQFPDSLLGVI